MPGKVNPVIPEVVLQVAAQVIGNDTAITIGGMQGQFELNVRVPLIARNLLQSIHLLATASTALRREVRRRRSRPTRRARTARPRRRSPSPPRSTRTSATTRRRRSSRRPPKSGRTLREVAIEQGVDEELYDRRIDLRRIAAGSQADQQADDKPARANARARGRATAARAAARLSARRREAAHAAAAGFGRPPYVNRPFWLMPRASAISGAWRRIDPPSKSGDSAKSWRFHDEHPGQPRLRAVDADVAGQQLGLEREAARAGRRVERVRLGAELGDGERPCRRTRRGSARATRRSGGRRSPAARAGRRTSPRSSCRRSRRRCGT